MALQKDTVSINIANSLDQKSDSKIIEPNKLARLNNRRFRKYGVLDKRPGQLQLSNNVETDYPNALSIETGSGKSTVASYKDQLVLSNNGALYSRRSDEEKWQFKGHSSYVRTSSARVSGASSTTRVTDSVVVDGKTVIVGKAGFNEFEETIYYSVIENDTGIYLAKSQTVSPFAFTVGFVKAVAVNNKAHIIYTANGNLVRVTVDLNDGSLGTPSTLKTDAKTSGFQFDVIAMNSTTLGPVFVVAYLRASNINIMLLDDDGVEITSPANVNTSEQCYDGLSLYHDSTFGNSTFYLAYQNTSLDLRSAKYTIGSSSISADYAPKTVTAAASCNWAYNSVAQSLDPLSGNLILFFDSYGRSYEGNPSTSNGLFGVKPDAIVYPVEASIDFVEIQSDGTVVTTATNYSKGFRMAARPFVDSARNTILLPLVYDSQVSSQYVLGDFNFGKTPRKFFSQAKWGYGRAQSQTKNEISALPNKATGLLPNINQIDVSNFSFAGMTRVEITGRTSEVFGGISSEGEAKYFVSPSIEEISLNYEASRSVEQASGGLYLSGGQLEHYDGNTISENGFLIDPEKVWASIQDTPVKRTFTNGTASTPAELVLKYAPGSAFDLLLGSPYITFDTPTTDYYIWFEIDGFGTDPALVGRTGIKATIDTSLSPGENVDRTVIPSGPYFVLISSDENENDTITITNSANGAVTAPTANNMDFFPLGSGFSTGSYQYCVVWKWVDAQGLTHRSAPSTPVTVASPGTVDSSFAGCVNFICPPTTNKDVNDCSFELYRTAVNGSVFYLLNEPSEYGVIGDSFNWDASGTRLSYVDTTADSELTRNTILYTQGGVFANYSPGQVDHISAHDERLLITDEAGNKILFSKAISEDRPIEFALENQIATLTDNQLISGHASLDGKIIIAKPDAIFVSAGQFQNDLGTSGSLTTPQEVASDTGVLNHNSIVLFPDGLIFKSKKGFYRLSRALQVDYIGQAVEDYNSNKVSKGVLDTLNNEIRFYHFDTEDCLVYNYLQGKWSVFQNHMADSASEHKDVIYRVKNNGTVHKSTEGIFKDITLDGSNNEVENFYSSEFELPWLKLKGLQDFQRIWFASLLGEYKSPHTIQAKFYYDYSMTETDTYSGNSEDIKTGIYQWKIKPRIQKCQAIKIKYTETPDSQAPGQTGESARFTDVSFDVGLKKGLNKLAKAKRS